jgi:hypothetical protein
MSDEVQYGQPDYYMISAGPQMTLNREYHRPTYSRAVQTEGLHSGEYFVEQGERQLRRLRATVYRCALAALVVVGLVYCAVNFLH